MGKFDNLTTPTGAKTNNIEDMIKLYSAFNEKLDKSNKELEKAYKHYIKLCNNVDEIKTEDKKYLEYIEKQTSELKARYEINKDFISKIDIKKEEIFSEINKKSVILKNVNENFKWIIYLNAIVIPAQLYILHRLFF